MVSADGVNGYNVIIPIAQTSVVILSKSNPGSWTSLYDQDRSSIFKLTELNKSPLLICAVHLPSKLHRGPLDQARIALDLAEEIKRIEQEENIFSTIVAGDFNMNPYDPGMCSILGLNAVSCKRVASSRRRFNGKYYDFFYNPCWNLMGDFSNPAGSYFYGSPGAESTYWHQLDQVIVRPSLAEAFIPSSLEVVAQLDGRSLCTINGRPKLSDHLPLKFSLNIQ